MLKRHSRDLASSALDLKTKTAGVFQLVAKHYINPQTFWEDYHYFFSSIKPPDYTPILDLNRRDLLEGKTPLINQELSSIPSANWTSPILKQKISSLIEKITKAKYGLQDAVTDDGSASKEKDASAAAAATTDDDNDVMSRSKTANKAVQHYLRWALTGGRSGPPIHDSMPLIGRDVCLQRLAKARDRIENDRL